MASHPLVSIITPSYNQAQFIEQTILSVLNQDYPAIEYLIIDGGSTDGSVDIIRRYSDRLAWWISEKDHGQADAINKGINHASGEIVAWLNSDDIYLPGAVSQAAAILSREPNLGMVYGDALSIDQDGKPLGKFSFGNWELLDLMSFRIICQPSVFMRRSILEQVGNLASEFQFMLDHHLWIRIAQISPVRHVGVQRLDSKEPTIGLWSAARYHMNAKNVAQAAGFSRETMQVLAWMEKQPSMNALISVNRRRIAAGAYRLNGRYLLDGGHSKAALGAYWHALINCPSYGFKHAHRMLYALLEMLKLDWIVKPLLFRIERKRRKSLTNLLNQTIFTQYGENGVKSNYPLSKWPFLELKHE